MLMTAKVREFEYSHGITPGLHARDVLIAWLAAMPLVLVLTATI